MATRTDLAVLMLNFCFIAEAAGFFCFVGDEEATLYNDKSCGEGLNWCATLVRNN